VKGDLGRALERARVERNKPIALTTTMWKILTTSKGWFVRQAMKYGGMASGVVAAWLYAQAEALHLPPEVVSGVVDPLAAAISGIALLLVEAFFSFIARKNK
jgi:hypothetical protein